MKRLFALALVPALLTLSSCASSGAGAKVVPVKAAPLLASEFSERDAEFAAELNDFAFKLGAELLPGDGENFICSPFSVWLPLAALSREDGLDAFSSRMLYGLTREQLKIANALFVAEGAAVKKSFAQDFADFYRGAVFNTNFASNAAKDAINKWASENTGGLITDIAPDFDPETVAAIANAIYFSDVWSGGEFNAELTRPGAFHGAKGDKTLDFMSNQRHRAYFGDGRVRAAYLNFQSGGGLWIILPEDGDADALLRNMTGDLFREIQDGAEVRDVALRMPKFEFESGLIDLADALKRMGSKLFDSENPVISDVIEGVNTYLSAAYQKALIKVDEKGTTAAAVTVMAMAGTGAPKPEEVVEMVCDKPFAFVLESGGAALFTGVFNG